MTTVGNGVAVGKGSVGAGTVCPRIMASSSSGIRGIGGMPRGGGGTAPGGRSVPVAGSGVISIKVGTGGRIGGVGGGGVSSGAGIGGGGRAAALAPTFPINDAAALATTFAGGAAPAGGGCGAAGGGGGALCRVAGPAFDFPSSFAAASRVSFAS